MLNKEEIEKVLLPIISHLEWLNENHIDENFDDMYENALKALNLIRRKLK